MSRHIAVSEGTEMSRAEKLATENQVPRFQGFWNLFVLCVKDNMVLVLRESTDAENRPRHRRTRRCEANRFRFAAWCDLRIHISPNFKVRFLSFVVESGSFSQ